MTIVPGYDVIKANIGHVPRGHQMAGYSTGSPDICWTRGDFNAHPGAIWIDQDAGAEDDTADCLDVERGAATIAESPGWVKRAQASYSAAKRPGQRTPSIYLSASMVSSLANALVTGGVRGGCGLVVANWNLTEPQAVAEVKAAAGPFPIVGVQYHSFQFYDVDVWSGHWLAGVSAPGGGGKTWQTLTTDGTMSLQQIADSVGMSPSHILRVTADHNWPGYGQTFDDVTAAWLNAVLAPVTEPIPPGAKLRVLR